MTIRSPLDDVLKTRWPPVIWLSQPDNAPHNA